MKFKFKLVFWAILKERKFIVEIHLRNFMNIASEFNLSKHEISWLINGNSIRIPLDISLSRFALKFSILPINNSKILPKIVLSPPHDVIQCCVLVYNRANRNIFQNLIIMRMFTIFCLGDFSFLFLIHHHLTPPLSFVHIP